MILALSLISCTVVVTIAWPRLFPSLVSRTRTAYDQGNWSEAAELANQRLKSAPNDIEALRILARVAVRERRDKSARAIYSRLGGASAMEAEDLYLTGVVMNRAGDRATARECWATGLLTDPNHPELLDEFTQLSIESRQFDRAASLARKLATRPGWKARGNLLLGQIEYELDDPASAVEALRIALDGRAEKAPSSPPALTRKLLARALLRLG
jgi:Tfp pilus assembly protein PilF